MPAFESQDREFENRMIARARVTKHGRTVTVSACDVFAVTDGRERIIATMLGTLMTVRERQGLKG